MKAKNHASEKHQACSTFAVDGIAKLPSLVGRLVNVKRVVDRYVHAQLSQGTIEALADYPGPGSDPLTMHGLLVKDLNKIIRGPSIYNNERFAAIALRSRTQRLLSVKPEGEDCHRLNRLLLEDAYPRNLSREPISHSFEQQAKGNVAEAKAQLKAIHQKQCKRTRKSKWRRRITRHFVEAVLPHCRQGSKDYQKGRDDGFFLGGLICDKQAAEAQSRLPNRTDYLREIEQSIDAWTAEKEDRLATVHPRIRKDYDRGFDRGMELAQQHAMLMNKSDPDQADMTLNPATDADYMVRLLTRLWNRLPAIITRCKSIQELFEWLHGCSAKDNPQFPAFQKLCQRIGIKLRRTGRPRKIRKPV